MFGKLFGAMAAPHILCRVGTGGAGSGARTLLVADAGEFAGHIMAAELGCRAFEGLRAAAPRAAGGRSRCRGRRRCGVRGDWSSWHFGGAYDTLYLDIYPPPCSRRPRPTCPAASFASRHRRRRVRDIVAAALPDGRPDAPLVYVTMGTVFNDPQPLCVAVAALRDLGRRGLVTVGPRADPAVVGAPPAHVRVERYVPRLSCSSLRRGRVACGGRHSAGNARAGAAAGLSCPGADQFSSTPLHSRQRARRGGSRFMPGAGTWTRVRDATFASSMTRPSAKPPAAQVLVLRCRHRRRRRGLGTLL